MMTRRQKMRIAGLAITCFGLGVLLTFFLPMPLLVIIASAILVAAGFLFLKF